MKVLIGMVLVLVITATTMHLIGGYMMCDKQRIVVLESRPSISPVSILRPCVCPEKHCGTKDLFSELIKMQVTPNATCGGEPTTFDGTNDYCRFYLAPSGIARITKERWRAAQAVESSIWSGNSGGDDRNEQHALWFDQYKALTGRPLGRMLEIGSGPFTQTKTLLSKVKSHHGVISITLADPLMIFYHINVPSCSYKSGSLMGYPTYFIASGGEELSLRAEYDSVVMLNVLEHCFDAIKVLENLHGAVRTGGVLVFSERWYDSKWAMYKHEKVPFWDIMHPINIKRAVIEELLEMYEPLYRRDFYYEGDYPTDEGVYFIGVKK